jgi:phosphoribosylformimino-5-aminoimidazole carboxamide ribotide isomerase
VTFALFPAIDLRGGRCVRLYQGDYGQETVYGDDPPAQARRFADAGAPWVHVVDLDAARSGDPVNLPVVAAIARALPPAVALQCGGGARSAAAVEALVDAGVQRVVVGTAALEDPSLVRHLAPRFRVAVGLDVRGREVAVRGWERTSGADVLDAVDRFAGSDVAAFVVTQIAVDGTLQGPDLDLYRALLGHTATPVVASGGVGTLEHLADLRDLEVGGRRLAGAIVGRALYEGTFTIEAALDVAGAR